MRRCGGQDISGGCCNLLEGGKCNLNWQLWRGSELGADHRGDNGTAHAIRTTQVNDLRDGLELVLRARRFNVMFKVTIRCLAVGRGGSGRRLLSAVGCSGRGRGTPPHAVLRDTEFSSYNYHSELPA